MNVMEPLRQEHRTLLPHIEALSAAADAVGELAPDDLRAVVDEQVRFLREHLVPHARAEDDVLYPEVEDVMRAPGATATMRRDHVEVVRLTDELADLRSSLEGRDPTAQERRSAQRLLDGLHAVVRLHFAKEEEVYLPVLEDELSPGRADWLFERMEKAAAGTLHRHP